MDTPEVKKLACLLYTYEADEPHAPPPGFFSHASVIYPKVTWEQLNTWLGSPHDGDCTKQAHTCMRCVADQIWHKAKWLAKNLKADLPESSYTAIGGMDFAMLKKLKDNK